ncbi:Homeobox_KN domain-containing protein/POX domain-containing protein [Cephalotus follicularis]|uniref:Homeobox_KN domain-containing protein/POX domain-containing protein n=1 Tax=Cephalotus follicularis TaxID=3775 RepID=A0A1Q3C774_CEPFO|nr:Homeobox_KN domain-containing protein/POX domain-containing protein [Cephalotus follicularis]
MARQLCEDKSRTMVPSSGFCYSDVSSSNPTIQSHLVNQIQGFESNDPEIFNLTTGMEMIGFSKNLHQQQSDTNSVIWKGFFNKSNTGPGPGPGPSSSKAIDESTSDFYQNDFNKPDHFTTGIAHHDTSSENLLVGHDSGSWQENRLLVDDSSFRCVFPCEANERPSQGLSLSLSSSNPSSIGLQSFELRQTDHSNHDHQEFIGSSSRDGFFGSKQQQMMQDGFLGKVANMNHNQGQFHLRNSKYLGPAQELLNEFCSLGTKQSDAPRPKPHKAKQWDDENVSSSSRNKSLSSLEFMELQKRKSRLLSMLEEVDRRYRHYCDQMKAVLSSFEEVAGNGAASVYSALASKAMSRHFRCLRDGIVGQIQATKKAMGEKDPVAPGTTRGETPRLKILDQALRQQRAFQQMSMMESHPWRPQRGLPERSVSVLRAWLFEHFLHPYPSDVDKHILARQTGLSRSQVSNWFINARVRLWKPMVEEMYLEETKEKENNMASSDGITDLEDNSRLNHDPITDQKPTPDQLVRIDSECLSSIINNNPDKNESNKSTKALQNHHMQHHQQQQSFGSFGAMELDFSSYNHHTAGGVSYANDSSTTATQNFNGGTGVSLTLGLQQHGGSGVSLAFSPASQSSLFFPRDHMEDCQPVQYSLLDGEGQNLPYRNLMGAQLLHDLAG